MDQFVPRRALFEPNALEYDIGKSIYDKLISLGTTVAFTGSHNRVTGIPGRNPAEAYAEAKNTLVVGVRKSLEFATCKPSAHYQLPLATSCPGMCQYCYLSSTLGKKPYLRLYVNIDEILEKARQYINVRSPEITIFEGAATSDPIPTEYLSGLLYKSIEFFGKQPLGRFRFVTKFTDIDSLLSANHGGNTRFRFSLNAPSIVRRFENKTPQVAERILAAAKAARAGYPIGFIIAPIFLFPSWQIEYEGLLRELSTILSTDQKQSVTFECITHRFTTRAKNQIMEIFPQNELPFDEAERTFKYGQFGYGKYVYTKDMFAAAKQEMQRLFAHYFPEAKIEYFV